MYQLLSYICMINHDEHSGGHELSPSSQTLQFHGVPYCSIKNKAYQLC